MQDLSDDFQFGSTIFMAVPGPRQNVQRLDFWVANVPLHVSPVLSIDIDVVRSIGRLLDRGSFVPLPLPLVKDGDLTDLVYRMLQARDQAP